MITLFHGSDKNIEKPLYGFGRSDCDYGSGFYLCDDKDLAAIWAEQYKDGGFINSYRLDLSNLRVLYLNHATKEDALAWIATLCVHRVDAYTRSTQGAVIDELAKRYGPDLSQYDLVIGYRADDSYYQYTAGFLNGSFPLELLLEAMKAGSLGLQYVLKSQKAFREIRYIGAERVMASSRYETLSAKLGAQYDVLQKRATIDMTYVRDILREAV